MGIKRVVDTAFWTDGKVDEFSPEDKYFLLYLLTNPFSKQLGIYEISIKHAAFQMGYSVDAFKTLLDRFENKYKMILFSPETNEVAVLNFLRHSVLKGGKPVEDCLRKEIALVKNRKLLDAVFARLATRDDLNETVQKIVVEFHNDNENQNDNEIHNDNDNDNDNERIVHDSSTYRQRIVSVIDHLNTKAGTNHNPERDDIKTILQGIFDNGYTEDDCKAVIDKKCAEWLGTEWAKFLRPSTLFGDKFKGYFESTKEAPQAPQTGNPFLAALAKRGEQHE